MKIVITGASKGLGKAMAKIFAAEGHQLFLCSRGEGPLQQTTNELQAAYPAAKIASKSTDTSNKTAVHDFANWILEQCVPDVVINNAGQFVPGSIHLEADGVLENMLQQNLFSAYYLTRALLPAMMQNRAGHIVNICSIASLQAYDNGGSYSISKHAMFGFSRNLREEMKPHGIKVTAVLPGAAYTASWEGAGIDPLRIMTAEDIAIMVAAACRLSAQACVEDIVLRPLLGDL
jgi:short-subunit dehydrogenase